MAEPTNADENGGMLNHLYNAVTGALTPKGGASPQNPNKVPLGSGMADQAKKTVKSRGQQIDQAVADAGG